MGRMALWNVTVPIAGHAFVTVEAATEDEAVDKGLEAVTLADIDSWDALRAFNDGNVCHCPGPWRVEATKDSD